jgi:hypothetical protein
MSDTAQMRLDEATAAFVLLGFDLHGEMSTGCP